MITFYNEKHYLINLFNLNVDKTYIFKQNQPRLSYKTFLKINSRLFLEQNNSDKQVVYYPKTNVSNTMI